MDWRRSLERLYDFRTEAELYESGAQELLDVMHAYIAPPSKDAARVLNVDWEYQVDGVPTNILGIGALEFALENLHGKKRRDGSPLIVHQLSQTFYQSSFPTVGIALSRPSVLACISLLHDKLEEEGISPRELVEHLQRWLLPYAQRKKLLISVIGKLFEDIEDIGEGVNAMSKVIPGHKAPMSDLDYYQGTLLNVFATVGKPLDIMHNVSSFGGANSKGKIGEKLEETELLMLTDIYKVAGHEAPMQFFQAATYYHPENSEAYAFLHCMIRTAVNIHIAQREKERKLAQGKEPIVDDTTILIPGILKRARLPRVLRPLNNLIERAENPYSLYPV